MKLSVATPSFQQGRFLGETLASVRRAAELLGPGDAIEHWVQDGGSTDETLQLLQEQTFARWESAPDRGQAHAVNLAWQHCTGDVLCFLCSDDLWESENIPRVLETFRRHPQVDVVYGDYFFLEGSTGWKRLKRAEPWSAERLHVRNFLSQPAVFFRRWVYEKFGGLDESLRFCLDHEYWLRIAPETRWYYLPEPLAAMRLHPDAKTSAQLPTAWWEGARMLQRYGRNWGAYWGALRMQIYGQHLYRLRRQLLQWVANRRMNRHAKSLGR